ncbi:MAG: DUF2029 domain-containing protein, partial [Planctomycetes bacterium]|nr:DUF2029 domain-containing protein [Planctomycetota bacterium]
MPANRLHAASVAFLVLTGLLLAGMSLGVPGVLEADPVDATVYWEAGERMRAGGDEIYGPGGWDNKSGLYLYPPGFAALCAPLTWLDDRPEMDPRDRSVMKPYPYPTVIRLWVALHAALWLAALWLIGRMPGLIRPGAGARSPRAALAASATAAMFAAVLLDTWLGNINLLILLLLVFGLYLVARGRALGGGAVLGAAAMIKIMPVALLPLLLLTRQWRAAAGMALGAVLLALAPLPFTIAAHGPVGGVA